MHVGMQKDPRFHLEDPPRARQVEGGWARPPLPRGSAAMGWQMPEQRGAWGCREPGEDGAGIGAMGSTGQAAWGDSVPFAASLVLSVPLSTTWCPQHATFHSPSAHLPLGPQAADVADLRPGSAC